MPWHLPRASFAPSSSLSWIEPLLSGTIAAEISYHHCWATPLPIAPPRDAYAKSFRASARNRAR